MKVDEKQDGEVLKKAVGMDGKLSEYIGAQGVYKRQLAKLGRDETTIWWNLK